jgi:hypothetical protein
MLAKVSRVILRVFFLLFLLFNRHILLFVAFVEILGLQMLILVFMRLILVVYD